MPNFFQASTYNTTDFVDFLRCYFKVYACQLCFRVHRLYIHDYVGRLIRNRLTHENEEIVICVIICHRARREGRQYTKRMLPPFVIPECNITLENVLRMHADMPDKPIDYDLASGLLGTIFEATIRRHYQMITAYMEMSISLLAGYLAQIAAFQSLPGEPPYEDHYRLFVQLSQAVLDSEVKRSGRYPDPPPAALYVHPVYVFHKARASGIPEKPFNLVSVIRFYFDSS